MCHISPLRTRLEGSILLAGECMIDPCHGLLLWYIRFAYDSQYGIVQVNHGMVNRPKVVSASESVLCE